MGGRAAVWSEAHFSFFQLCGAGEPVYLRASLASSVRQKGLEQFSGSRMLGMLGDGPDALLGREHPRPAGLGHQESAFGCGWCSWHASENAEMDLSDVFVSCNIH